MNLRPADDLAATKNGRSGCEDNKLLGNFTIDLCTGKMHKAVAVLQMWRTFSLVTSAPDVGPVSSKRPYSQVTFNLELLDRPSVVSGPSAQFACAGVCISVYL